MKIAKHNVFNFYAILLQFTQQFNIKMISVSLVKYHKCIEIFLTEITDQEKL